MPNSESGTTGAGDVLREGDCLLGHGRGRCRENPLEVGITVSAYTKAIGPVKAERLDLFAVGENPLYMPDPEAAEKAAEYLSELQMKGDSAAWSHRMHGDRSSGWHRRAGLE